MQRDPALLQGDVSSPPQCATSRTPSTRSRGSQDGKGHCVRLGPTPKPRPSFLPVLPLEENGLQLSTGGRLRQEHLPGVWHGYPVPWSEVPAFVMGQFEAERE